jgi:tetratricopeptide (TPR) repeat protein
MNAALEAAANPEQGQILRGSGDMPKTICWIAGVVAVMGFMSSWAAGQAARAPSDGDRSGDVALAARLSELSRQTLQSRYMVEPIWHQAAALLEAAMELDPAEERYPKLLAEARLQLRDRDGALAAWNAYRRVNHGDHVAQIQVIDLHLGRMETLDGRLNYLMALLDQTGVPSEVRSHAAVQAVRVLLERGQTDQARSVLGQALRLNPSNIDALRLRYQFVLQNGTKYERVTALLALMRANPAQPEVAGQLAKEVAGVGLVQQSLGWFQLSVQLSQVLGRPVGADVAREFAAQLFIAEQAQPAEEILGQLLEVDPGDVEAWLIRLALHRRYSTAEGFEAARRQASNALMNRLIAVQEAAGVEAPTTRPVDGPPAEEAPNLSAVLEVAQEDPDLLEALVSAVTDLAWFHVYYNERPEMGRRLVQQLEGVLDERSVTRLRLLGWADLREERVDRARERLSEVAEVDPLSQMGVLRIEAREAQDRESRQRAESRGRALFAQHPSGLMGAMLWDGLRDLRVGFVETPQSEAVREELEQFPREWLRVLERPQEFYSIRVDPLKVSHGFGEPMIARVTITNLSSHDLTLGAHGVVRPDLWFDARLRGLAGQAVPQEAQVLPGTAFDRLTGRVVLRPRQNMSQLVRVDQGRLTEVLSRLPMLPIQVNMSVMTNPQTIEDRIGVAPGGYQVQFTRLLERQGIDLARPESRQQVYQTIAEGAAVEKIRKLELLTATIRVLVDQEQPPEEAQAIAREMAAVIRRATTDRNPAVSAWANYQMAFLMDDDQRVEVVRSMAQDDDWRRRMVAATMARFTPMEVQRELTSRLSEDERPVVREYARGLSGFLDLVEQAPADEVEAMEEVVPAVPPLPPIPLD